MMESVERIREKISEQEAAREELEKSAQGDLQKNQYPYFGGLDEKIHEIDQYIEYLNSNLLLRRLKDLDCPFPPSDARKELWQQKLTDEGEIYELLSSSGVYEATERISLAEERAFQRMHLLKSQKNANIAQLIAVVAAVAAVASAIVPVYLENIKHTEFLESKSRTILTPLVGMQIAPTPKPLDLSFGPCSPAWQISSCPSPSAR